MISSPVRTGKYRAPARSSTGSVPSSGSGGIPGFTVCTIRNESGACSEVGFWTRKAGRVKRVCHPSEIVSARLGYRGYEQSIGSRAQVVS